MKISKIALIAAVSYALNFVLGLLLNTAYVGILFHVGTFAIAIISVLFCCRGSVGERLSAGDIAVRAALAMLPVHIVICLASPYIVTYLLQTMGLSIAAAGLALEALGILKNIVFAALAVLLTEKEESQNIL